LVCQLSKENPPGVYDFVAVTGAQMTVFAESDSGLVRIVAGTLNGTPVPVDADGNASFTAIAGVNLLNLAFVGPDPNEDFRIKEDCQGGDSQQLASWRIHATPPIPGGPSRAFQIYAS
jgi:hypothetical protein